LIASNRIRINRERPFLVAHYSTAPTVNASVLNSTSFGACAFHSACDMGNQSELALLE